MNVNFICEKLSLKKEKSIVYKTKKASASDYQSTHKLKFLFTNWYTNQGKKYESNKKIQ